VALCFEKTNVNKNQEQGWGSDSAAERLSRKHKALSSKPGIAKKKLKAE
jgi:hypothetical protein